MSTIIKQIEKQKAVNSDFFLVLIFTINFNASQKL